MRFCCAVSSIGDFLSLYAIGDIQGCHAELCELLAMMGFAPAHDRLWLVGDLVNRGPGSLDTLRYVRDLGDAAITVLGNHDFHLLRLAAGYGKAHRGDTLEAILEAHDRDELIAWLGAVPGLCDGRSAVMVALSALMSGLDAELVRLGYKASTMVSYRGC